MVELRPLLKFVKKQLEKAFSCHLALGLMDGFGHRRRKLRAQRGEQEPLPSVAAKLQKPVVYEQPAAAA
jgi:hypothetical protein